MLIKTWATDIIPMRAKYVATKIWLRFYYLRGCDSTQAFSLVPKAFSREGRDAHEKYTEWFLQIMKHI